MTGQRIERAFAAAAVNAVITVLVVAGIALVAWGVR